MSDNKTVTAPTNDELFSLTLEKWKEVKPSVEAQRIRAQISTEIDSGKHQERDLDYIPDYVWHLVDIAAQRGINVGRI